MTRPIGSIGLDEAKGVTSAAVAYARLNRYGIRHCSF